MTDEPVATAIRSVLLRAGLLLAWAPIIILAPWLVVATHQYMPTILQNFLFFWPQAVLPLATYQGMPPNVGPRVWPGWWLLYWLAIMGAFSAATRKVRPLWAFALAGVVI